jgi:hypothetical protein
VIVFAVFFTLSAAATLAWCLAPLWRVAHNVALEMEQERRRAGTKLITTTTFVPPPACGPHEPWDYCHPCTVAEIEASLQETA